MMRFGVVVVLVVASSLATAVEPLWDPAKLCFDGAVFTPERCCQGRDESCFGGGFVFDECCNDAGTSWWSAVFRVSLGIDSWLYTISDFYTDAQYGEDFGYYYRGRVLLNGSLEDTGASEADNKAEGFAHYTTFPMALSPHFGAVVCRKLFAMWTSLGEPALFPVFEFGAGSGQLASDIRELCGNFQGEEVTDKLSTKGHEYEQFGKIMNRWGSRKFLRFRRALQYTIVERSLALVHRQRRRGHRVVIGDAQDPETTCKAVKNERNFTDAVIISNELIDAFAPSKLRLILGRPEISDCAGWQETRVMHFSEERNVAEILGDERASVVRSRTEAIISDLLSSSVMRAVKELLLPDQVSLNMTEKISVVLTLVSLADYASDLRLPLYAHEMVLRIRRDPKLQDRLKYVYTVESAAVLSLAQPVLLDKSTYREIRKTLKGAEEREVAFIRDVLSRRVNAPLTESRCPLYQAWMKRHSHSIARVQHHYRMLGYTTTQFGVRLGEEQYMHLVNCLLGDNRGFVLSIDYGANFEALANSISSTPLEDGVSVPPIPPNLLTAGLPSDCQSNWLRCPGFIDYTSFIDFTNVAKVGEELGFLTVLYGPQSSLERNLALSISERSERAVPPLYEIKDHLTPRTQWRHVISWYGNENLPGVQRWTSFKALVQAKNIDRLALQRIHEWTISWPLTVETVDPCYDLDFTAYPQTDSILRTADGWQRLTSGRFQYSEVLEQYNDLYEEAHLTLHLTDFLESALGRDVLCRGGHLQMAWWKIKNSRWFLIWGEARIAKILELLFRHVYERNWTQDEKLPPGLCLARRKFAILCGIH